MVVHVPRRAHHARQGQGAQCDQRKRPHSAHPPEGLDQRLRDPRALMIPAALPRLSSVSRRAAAPISTEKLPAPAPTAANTPSATTRPNPEVMKGVKAVPIESTTSPATRTFPGPYRSATAPATGWMAPHI